MNGQRIILQNGTLVVPDNPIYLCEGEALDRISGLLRFAFDAAAGKPTGKKIYIGRSIGW
jgi:hypothetical protein